MRAGEKEEPHGFGGIRLEDLGGGKHQDQRGRVDGRRMLRWGGDVLQYALLHVGVNFGGWGAFVGEHGVIDGICDDLGHAVDKGVRPMCLAARAAV